MKKLRTPQQQRREDDSSPPRRVSIGRIAYTAFLCVTMAMMFCQPAFAISEEEVQAKVDAVGKEAVSGNVLICFMCAIGFLKV